MRGTYRYIAFTFPLMSSSLWVVHKVDSGLLSGVSRHTQHTCKAAVCQLPGDGADFFRSCAILPSYSEYINSVQQTTFFPHNRGMLRRSRCVLIFLWPFPSSNRQQLAVASEGLLLFGLWWSGLLQLSTVGVHYIQVQRQHFYGVE